jgi:hypothetical protein
MVPVNAVLLVAAVSLGLGLYAAPVDGIALMSSLVNFGASRRSSRCMSR